MHPRELLRLAGPRKLGIALSEWGETVAGLIFPPYCQLCGRNRSSQTQGYVCQACQNRLRPLDPPFCSICALPYPGELTETFRCANCDGVRFAFEWARSSLVITDTLLEIIHRYKYKGHSYFEPLLGRLLVERAAPVLNRSDWDWLIPVPLHPLRQREREFNQADRLARYLSQATGIPVNEGRLSRVEWTRTQTTLGRAERRSNVHKAFIAKPLKEIRKDRMVVVDDVLTTGSTTHACAQALKRAGAGRVVVWTLARGLVGTAALNLTESRIDSSSI